MFDRLYRHHRIKQKGKSLRKPPPKFSEFDPELDEILGETLQLKPRNAQPRRIGHVPEISGHIRRNKRPWSIGPIWLVAYNGSLATSEMRHEKSRSYIACGFFHATNIFIICL